MPSPVKWYSGSSCLVPKGEIGYQGKHSEAPWFRCDLFQVFYHSPASFDERSSQLAREHWYTHPHCYEWVRGYARCVLNMRRGRSICNAMTHSRLRILSHTVRMWVHNVVGFETEDHLRSRYSIFLAYSHRWHRWLTSCLNKNKKKRKLQSEAIPVLNNRSLGDETDPSWMSNGAEFQHPSGKVGRAWYPSSCQLISRCQWQNYESRTKSSVQVGYSVLRPWWIGDVHMVVASDMHRLRSILGKSSKPVATGEEATPYSERINLGRTTLERTLTHSQEPIPLLHSGPCDRTHMQQGYLAEKWTV